ncbi:restriction endonuclease subunit S [Marinobacterium arenosum]|uniref:restriction endonuclease subunit S n=1 Tax=Marinobacterium arenosum TaxID=2862496 RepID=UPI001C94C7F4|nr:restriction endonuclease subunit S [Marinobacterium arenosum]MBY4678313.1 restriction endonuclease subunit S [Marinobacterium arenosum]
MNKKVMGVQEVSPGYEFVAEIPAVPVGYKQTEVGVIPEDWSVWPLSEIGVFYKGQGVKRSDSTSGNIPCIRYGEIYTHHNDIVRSYVSHISQEVAKTARRLHIGDVLFAGSGETKSEIGKAVAFISEDEAYAGGDIVILRQRKMIPAFLGYVLNAPPAVRQKSSKGQGDAVVHISAKALAAVKVPIPPEKDQSAIATALSDMDVLLEELDRLIAKKRDIKQAAMQQLLTGETRLPGFEGEWVTRQLGEVIEKLDAGVSVNSTTDMSIEGRPSVLKTSALENGTLDITETKVIVDKDLSRATLTPKKDTILISRMNTPNLVGETAYVSDDLNWIYLPDRIWMAQFKKSAGVCVKWMSYMLCSPSYRNALREMATGTSGSMKNISKPALLSLKMKFPKQSEQEAIAAVISDMDTEIQALEQRRSKTAELKQGMMQELLTGRTRLV